MLEKFKAHLRSPLQKEHTDSFYKSLVRSFFWPTLIIGALVMAFEAFMMVVTLLQTGQGQWTPERRTYFALYVILFVLTFLYMTICFLKRAHMRRKPVFFLTIAGIYGLIICYWGSFLAAFSHRRSDDLTVFIYVSLCVAILINCTIWQSILLFGSNLIFFYICLSQLIAPEVDGYSNMINSFIVTVLCIAISGIMHRSRVQNYINSVTILAQNQQITTINEQLRRMVHTDNLTKAYNRRYLDEVLPERLAQELQAHHPVCLMMLDIDHFKQYNDIYGHVDGDTCLQTISSIIMDQVQEPAAAFVRYGGEEFVLFLSDMDETQGMEAAENIRKSIARARIVHSGSPWGYVTISIGVCMVQPGESTAIQQLVHNADQALYTAKNSGRNQVSLFQPGSLVAEFGSVPYHH